MNRPAITSWLGLLLGTLIAATATAGTSDGTAAAHATPNVTLIIDDLGYRLEDDQRAVSLPGPISYAILPHTPHARRIAELAHTLDKDILVHLPMEALRSNHLLGPGALTGNMSKTEFTQTVKQDIAAIPHAVGISNHMGSLLTTSQQAMHWLMQTIQSTGMFYMDSMTIAESVAGQSASAYQVPYLQRDVFLDEERDPTAIRAQFRELIRIAKEQGSAIGIAHPHPETITTLATLLPRLSEHGVKLISIREMLQINSPEVLSWQSSSSP